MLTEEPHIPKVIPVTSNQEDTEQRALIDRSLRGPVLLLFVASVKWLVIACMLGAASSWVYNHPLHGGGVWYWAHYGRLLPAAKIALYYGWAVPVGMGVGLWIMARISRVPLYRSGLVYFGIIAWYAVVVAALIGVLFGGSTSHLAMEFPKFAGPPLLIAFLFLGSPLIGMFHSRRPGPLFISQYYLVGAVLWFALVFVTSWMMLHGVEGLGVYASGVASWYASNFIFLFMVPIGLATAYYFIPKISGEPIASYEYAKLGFWSLAILAPWTGFQQYTGGPFPNWIPAISGLAMILMIVPAVMVGINHHRTLRGRHHLAASSPTLRFTVVGAVAYTVFSAVTSLLITGLSWNSAQFTQALEGVSLLATLPFFTMCMFGAMYFIVPRLTGCEWLSRRMIRFHFWSATWAFGLLPLLLILCGYSQGEMLNLPENWNFQAVNMIFGTAGYLTGAAVMWVVALISVVVFFLHLALMALGLGRRSASPTLFHHPDDNVSH